MDVKRLAAIILTGTVTAAAPAAAQQAPSRAAAEQRYQIGQMERVLEGAVEHGLTSTRDRVQALAQVPADLLVSENAHARGFRLEGYGVFFDVVVPSFETTLTWSLRTLDQNDLGLDSALRTLQTHVKGEGDPNLEQALKRLELQVNPAVLARSSVPVAPGARNATGSAASANDTAGRSGPHRSERGLPDRGAAGAEGRDARAQQLARHRAERMADDRGARATTTVRGWRRPTAARATRIIRLRGSDLAEFLAGRITREEALKRIEVRVF